MNYNEDIIEAFALVAEMEGMKAANKMRELNGQALAYSEEAFYEIADKLRKINSIRAAKNKDADKELEKLIKEHNDIVLYIR